MAAKLPKLPTLTNWRGKARSLETPIAKGRSAALPGQASCEDATMEKGNYLGRTFSKNGYSSTRVGKIFHMRVPGDIIAGTDGDGVPACWSAKYNMPGKEAHTPGNYACLNLDKFTTELQGRQSTKMPFRMFVTVDYAGDGSDQPDWKAATKSVELLKNFKKEGKPFFLATGLVRPHYPNVRAKAVFRTLPLQANETPLRPEGRLGGHAQGSRLEFQFQKYGIDKFPDNQKRMWSGYLATVTFMDEQVGRILNALKELGGDKETAVFFTSDHGYLLGEHHFWQKGNLEGRSDPGSPHHQSSRSKTRTNLLHRRVGRHVPHRLALTGCLSPRAFKERVSCPFWKTPRSTSRNPPSRSWEEALR